MKLGEIADIRSGLVLSRKEAKYELDVTKTYRVLTVKSIPPDGSVNAEELYDFRSIEELDEHYLTHAGDVVIRLTHPYTAVHIDESLERLVISSLFAVIRLKTELFLPQYIALYLNSNTTENLIYRLHSTSSSPSIKKSFLEELKINKVPVEVQMKLLDYSRLHRKEKELLLDLLNQKEVHYQAIISKTITKEG